MITACPLGDWYAAYLEDGPERVFRPVVAWCLSKGSSSHVVGMVIGGEGDEHLFSADSWEGFERYVSKPEMLRIKQEQSGLGLVEVATVEVSSDQPAKRRRRK